MSTYGAESRKSWPSFGDQHHHSERGAICLRSGLDSQLQRRHYPQRRKPIFTECDRGRWQFVHNECIGSVQHCIDNGMCGVSCWLSHGYVGNRGGHYLSGLHEHKHEKKSRARGSAHDRDVGGRSVRTSSQPASHTAYVLAEGLQTHHYPLQSNSFLNRLAR